MRRVLLLFLVLTVIPALAQNRCFKAKNTNIYIEPSRNLSAIGDGAVALVPKEAPFDSTAFDTELGRSILERVRNITLLPQQPLPRGGIGIGPGSPTLAIQEIDQLRRYAGVTQDNSPRSNATGVMFISEYNCAVDMHGQQGRTPGGYCQFRVEIQLGSDPEYWNFPRNRGAYALVSKSTPGFLKQAADELADGLEKYRLEAERLCSVGDSAALAEEKSKEAYARQRAAFAKEDLHDKQWSYGYPGASPEETKQIIEGTAIRTFREGGTVDTVTAGLKTSSLSAKGCKRREVEKEYRAAIGYEDCEFAAKYFDESVNVSFFRGRAQSMTITVPADRLDRLVKLVSSIYGQPRVTANDNAGIKSLVGYDWGSSQEHLRVHAGTQRDGVHSWVWFSNDAVGSKTVVGQQGAPDKATFLGSTSSGQDFSGAWHGECRDHNTKQKTNVNLRILQQPTTELLTGTLMFDDGTGNQGSCSVNGVYNPQNRSMLWNVGKCQGSPPDYVIGQIGFSFVDPTDSRMLGIISSHKSFLEISRSTQ